MKSVFSMIFPKEMSTGIQSFFLASLATAETAVSTAAVPEAEAPQPMGLVNCHIAIENPPFFMGKSPFLMGKHHFFNGKTHYFDWAIFNSELLVYQRVYIYIYMVKELVGIHHIYGDHGLESMNLTHISCHI